MTFWLEQMAHEPTQLYYEKLKEIVQKIYSNGLVDPPFDINPLEILEIGLDVGISARCFLEFIPIKLTSVDGGDVEQGIKNIEEWGFKDRWIFHRQRSDDYFSECKKQFDIIYIDGDHAYEQVKRDINNAWKFVKEGGVIIGHDFLHKGNFKVGNLYDRDTYGVTRAFCEFMNEQNCEAQIYPPEPGLIVIQK